jgi:Spy/CpxP family protein refolding chaperone
MVALIGMSLKDLDLTAEQRTTVEKIRADLVAKMEPARAAGKDLANVLADGVAAGAVNRAKADASIDKLSAQVAKLHDAVADSLNQLHAALTAPQRADLVDKVQAHWERWKDALGQDEKDDPQHRSGHLLSLVKSLNLTPEEAQKIKASFKDLNKAKPQEHQHKEVVDHLKAFATAFKADKFDAKKLTTANAANVSLAKWGATRRARFLEAAAPILTPDQRTKLAQIIRDWGDKTDS